MACNDSDYEYLRELVWIQSANQIAPSRNTQFDIKLTSLAEMAGARSLEEFINLLRTDQPVHLHRAVAEAMTVNETSFFRDIATFDMLRNTVLPALVESRREQRRLRIWSAASSTGQEAYSLAMLLVDSLPEISEWDIEIQGTDISGSVVEYAREGRYRRLEVNRGLPARMLLKHMTRSGEEWRVSPQLRSMCHFRQLNLCGPLTMLPVFDLVLLRNVLLYFSHEDRARVFTAVRDHMAEDSVLVLGNAEQAEEATNLFEVKFSEESFFYRPAIKKTMLSEGD